MANTLSGKTYKEYEDEYTQKELAGVEEVAARKKTNMDETLNSMIDRIDQNAAQASGVYQKRIDSSDAQYKTRYADNAVRDGFIRQQIKVAMANSGMTDSGYNRTMQTALALNRSRQDAAVTADKQSYVQKLQDAIDSVMTQAETEKLNKSLAMEQEYQNWYDSETLNAKNRAISNATTVYGDDVQALTDQKELEWEQEQANRKREEDLVLSGIQAGVIDPMEGYAYLSGATDSYTIREVSNQGDDDFLNSILLQQAKDGNITMDEALVMKYGTNEEKVRLKLSQQAKSLGYTGDAAEAYINAGGGSEGKKAASKSIVESTGLTQTGDWKSMLYWYERAVDTNNYVHSGDYVYTDVASATKNWKKSDWEERIDGVINQTKKAVNKRGANLDEFSKEYAVGSSVANAIKAAVTPNNAAMLYEVLNDQLSEEEFNAAKDIIHSVTGILCEVS